MNPKQATVNDVLLFSLREYYDNGYLIPITSKQDVPFNMKRIFYVSGVHDNVSRGNHAHKLCSQVLVALEGTLDVFCYDGTNHREIVLDKRNLALLVPKGIWSHEIYRKDTALLVMCDHIYDPKEYIKDLDEYEEWKRKE